MDGIDLQLNEGEEFPLEEPSVEAPALAGDIRSNADWQAEQEIANSFSSDLDSSCSKPPPFCAELPGKIEPSSMGDAMILSCGLVYFPSMLHADMKGEGSLSFNLHPLDQRLLETELSASFNSNSNTSTYHEETGRGSVRFHAESARVGLPPQMFSNLADQQSHSLDESHLSPAFSCSIPGCTIDHATVLQPGDSFLYSSQPQAIGQGENFRGCSCRQCLQLLSGPLQTPSAMNEPCLLPCCNSIC